jgi:hypothetical protein
MIALARSDGEPQNRFIALRWMEGRAQVRRTAYRAELRTWALAGGINYFLVIQA